MKAKKEMRQKL